MTGSETDPPRVRAALRWLPNALTMARFPLALVAAAGFLGWAMDGAHARVWLWAGVCAFVAAGASDFLDGVLARALRAESRFGEILDPVADKVLVAAMAVALVAGLWAGGAKLLAAAALPAAAVIISRDIGVSVLRWRHGAGGGLTVTRLAKWKTALEIAAVGAPFAIAVFEPALHAAPPAWPASWAAWAGMLWLAAALSGWTGLAYWRAARANSGRQ